jgi:hypothetical protein
LPPVGDLELHFCLNRIVAASQKFTPRRLANLLSSSCSSHSLQVLLGSGQVREIGARLEVHAERCFKSALLGRYHEPKSIPALTCET